MRRVDVVSRYVFFNVVQSVPVTFTLNAADAVPTLASLGFLGYGVPPTPGWGLDISGHEGSLVTVRVVSRTVAIPAHPDISVPPRHSSEIVHGKRAVTTTARRSACYPGTTPPFWLDLPAQYDLGTETDRPGDRLDREIAAHAS